MRADATDPMRPVFRTGLLIWTVATLLVGMFGAGQHAAIASTMQLHGALNRGGAVGIVSHRGAAAIAPENTLAAMRVAIEQGVEFVETDVQLTADGVPVLLHDPTLDRTTSGSGPVAAHTLEQVKTLDAGSWFGASYAGEQIPTLEEFLNELDSGDVRALVEIKGVWSIEQLAAATELLRAHGMVNRVGLQSFELDTLEMLAEVAPEFARIMLTREWDSATVASAVALEVSAVGARTKLFNARPELLERLREHGIGSLAYTLNTEQRWQQAGERGIDLIVTDDPVRLAAWRDG